MPKINVYLPDELAEAVKEAGLPVSAICQRALEQAVRRITAIRETTLGGPVPDDPIARLTSFTLRARSALNLGLALAREQGAANLDTEHVLGGLLTEGGNLALQVLRAMEIDPETVRRELDRETAGGARAGAEDTDDVHEAGLGYRFSGPAANALELTVAEATALGHNYVGCEHLLLGLIAEPDGVAGHVLRGLGADQRLTRRAVSAALAGYVHLRAQTQGTTTPAPGTAPAEVAGGASIPAGTDSAAMLAAALRQELRPVLERLDRLEERVDAVTGDPATGGTR